MVTMTVRVPMFFRRAALAAAIAALAFSAACGGGAPKLPAMGSADADKFLFDRGVDALNRHKWTQAREYLKRLVEDYPTSAYRVDAKLGVGDAYMGENTSESKILAANEYREFLAFFPTNEHADYAQFNIALSHYRQMSSPQRDQTETRETIRQFDIFFQTYPATTTPPPAAALVPGQRQLPDRAALRAQADTLMRATKDRLSDSVYGPAYFYFRYKFYGGAINRFADILRTDPQYTRRDAVYFYLGESLHLLKRDPEAQPYYDRLVQEFAQSEFLERAKQRLAEIKH